MSLRRAALIALVITSVAAVALPAAAQGRRSPDANGDGKISLQEFLTQRGRIFDRVDANHDGLITKDEVTAFQSQMDSVAAGATIRSGRERGGGGREIGRLAELTANGPLTRREWDAMMTRRFQRLDTGNTGFITMDQMRPGRRSGADAAPAAMPPAAPPPAAAPQQ